MSKYLADDTLCIEGVTTPHMALLPSVPFILHAVIFLSNEYPFATLRRRASTTNLMNPDKRPVRRLFALI